MTKEIYLLDAYALIYRAYFAFMRNPMTNSKGLNTSAIFGFVNTLEQLMTNRSPEHIAVVFDVHADTFRHKMYPEYKANRETMPEDLRIAIPYIRRIIGAYNIPILEKEGYEADDVIGTIARVASDDGFVVYMMTPDKDYAQLVSDRCFMYKPAKNGGNPEVWGVDEVKKNFEIETPEQVIDILGLMGDSSDNVPGCPNIGPKSAMKLVSDFGGIEGVYNNIDKLKGKQKENLLQYKDQVLLSRKLVTIDRFVPIDIDFIKTEYTGSNKSELLAIYEELEFYKFVEKIRETTGKSSAGASVASTSSQAQQTLLFDFDGAAPEKAEEPVIEQKQLENIDTVEHRYYKIETESQRAELIAKLSAVKRFCFDTETTGLDVVGCDLVCLSFAIESHEAYCVLLPESRNEAQLVVNEFKDLFENEAIGKIGQNIKFDMSMLVGYGVKINGQLFDTMIAHYLIQPELRHNLDYLCEIYLNYKKINTESLIGKKGKNQQTMRSTSPDELTTYACEDADFTLQLVEYLEKELKDNNLNDLFYKIEMPLIPVLADMEITGAKIEPKALNEYAIVLRGQIADIEKDIYKLAGKEFLISSPKQLGIILFEDLRIDSNVKKTKTKQYSTSEETLEKLAGKHPIIDKILEYRGLKKLLNTYVETLPSLINPKTGRIHTSYNQAVTSTGRLSSTNPNLQNIPIRDENGRNIRKAFIPSDDNHCYLSADYSQIELRIMAALSQDRNLVAAFMDNQDVHSATASHIFNVPIDEVTKDMRRKAKTANFGIIYGISAFGLSQRLNIGRSDAKDLIDGYFASFPQVKIYMEESIARAREAGYVETLLGRKRYLNDIHSANATVRGMAERNAINAPIQGSAADIIKIAMVNIHREMEQRKLKSKMILQVHDELNFDVVNDELETMKEIVKEGMEHAFELIVPLIVDMNSGSNWLEAH